MRRPDGHAAAADDQQARGNDRAGVGAEVREVQNVGERPCQFRHEDRLQRCAERPRSTGPRRRRRRGTGAAGPCSADSCRLKNGDLAGPRAAKMPQTALPIPFGAAAKTLRRRITRVGLSADVGNGTLGRSRASAGPAGASPAPRNGKRNGGHFRPAHPVHSSTGVIGRCAQRSATRKRAAFTALILALAPRSSSHPTSLLSTAAVVRSDLKYCGA